MLEGYKLNGVTVYTPKQLREEMEVSKPLMKVYIQKMVEGVEFIKVDKDQLNAIKADTEGTPLGEIYKKMYTATKLVTEKGRARLLQHFGKAEVNTNVPVPQETPVASVEDIKMTDNKVDGRSLHEFLQSETPYTMWFERMTEYGFTEGIDFFTKMLKTTPPYGRPEINHELTIDMAKELCMIQRTPRGKQARQYFIECEKKLKAQTQKPMTQAELIAMQANALVEYEREQAKLKEDVKQIKEQTEHSTRILQSRIDTLNGVCTEGTPRQKLKAMVDLYAIKNGLQFGTAWREFVTAYNTAYRTNLKRKMKTYMRAHGIKKMTSPEYLEAVGKLDDAMRVADKMLNPKTNVFSF